MAALPRYTPTEPINVPEEGTHRCRFIDYGELKQSTQGDGQYMRLTFQVEDPESEDHGMKFGDNFGWTMSPKAKLFKVVRALYGGEIDEETDIDIEALKGKACMVTIEHVEKPDRENPKEMVTFARVVAASAIKKRAKPGPVVVAPTDDEDDDPFVQE